MVQVRKRRRGERLSALDVKRVTATGLYADGLNLNLQVSASGGKSWIFRYKVAGEETWLGLGPLHTVSLAEARIRAREMRLLLLDGKDPKSERDASKRALQLASAKTVTFDEAAKVYIDTHCIRWRNPKHIAQWRNTIRDYASPVIGKLPMAAVDTQLVSRVLEPLWVEKNETAMRLRGRMERILAWATVREYRQGENPARWRNHLKELLPDISRSGRIVHHPSLPYSELPAFLQLLRAQPGIAARALEFAVLTAARTGEVIGARWEEFDLAGKGWTVPAVRMKTKHEHWTPLSPPALALLKAVPQASDFVFFGSKHNKPISNMAMAAVLKRMERPDITVHGFRSSFRTWTDERTNYETQVAEFALAHGIEDKTQQAYRRGRFEEKRRKLAAEWARYCLTESTGGNTVVDIRAARK